MIWTITQRHLRIFFRDRQNVFFSLLSPLILFALYKLFLGNLQITSLQDEWPMADDDAIRNFVDSWVYAGMLMLTTLSTGLGAMAIFIDDRISGRFADFIVSPLRRRDLVLGYVIGGFLIAASISMLVLILSQVLTAISGGSLMDVTDILKSILYTLVMCATFSTLAGVVATFIRTSGAFSSLSALVGTFAGFLSMAYIPAAGLPDGVVRVLNWLPFAQSATLLRGPFTRKSLNELSLQQNEIRDRLTEYYGLAISFGGHTLSATVILGILAAIAIVLAVVASWRIGRVVA